MAYAVTAVEHVIGKERNGRKYPTCRIAKGDSLGSADKSVDYCKIYLTEYDE